MNTHIQIMNMITHNWIAKSKSNKVLAPHFFFPHTLRALEEEHEDNRLYAQNPIDIASLHPSELEEFVKGHTLSLSPS